MNLRMIDEEKLSDFWRWIKNLRQIHVQLYKSFQGFKGEACKTNMKIKLNLVN